MAYTLGDIRNRVIEDKLDDASYDPAVVDRFINDTQRSIFNAYELPFMEKTFSGVLPAGSHIFTFPDDYQVEQALVLTSPDGHHKDLTKSYIPFREFNTAFPTPANNNASAPSVWTLYGNRMYLSQPTDQTYTLELWYLKSPALLDDDADVPDLPQAFEELLVLGAFYRVLHRNEDFDLSAAIKNEYNEELDKLVSKLGSRQLGTPSIMRQPLRRQSRRRI